MLAILLIIVIIYIVHLFSTVSVKKITCDALEKPHKWVYRGEVDSEYMVCEQCSVTPGGSFEEESEDD